MYGPEFRLTLRSTPDSAEVIDLSNLQTVGQRPLVPHAIILDSNPPSSRGQKLIRLNGIEVHADADGIEGWIRAFQRSVLLVKEHRGDKATSSTSKAVPGSTYHETHVLRHSGPALEQEPARVQAEIPQHVLTNMDTMPIFPPLKLGSPRVGPSSPPSQRTTDYHVSPRITNPHSPTKTDTDAYGTVTRSATAADFVVMEDPTTYYRNNKAKGDQKPANNNSHVLSRPLSRSQQVQAQDNSSAFATIIPEKDTRYVKNSNACAAKESTYVNNSNAFATIIPPALLEQRRHQQNHSSSEEQHPRLERGDHEKPLYYHSGSTDITNLSLYYHSGSDSGNFNVQGEEDPMKTCFPGAHEDTIIPAVILDTTHSSRSMNSTSTRILLDAPRSSRSALSAPRSSVPHVSSLDTCPGPHRSEAIVRSSRAAAAGEDAGFAPRSESAGMPSSSGRRAAPRSEQQSGGPRSEGSQADCSTLAGVYKKEHNAKCVDEPEPEWATRSLESVRSSGGASAGSKNPKLNSAEKQGKDAKKTSEGSSLQSGVQSYRSIRTVPISLGSIVGTRVQLGDMDRFGVVQGIDTSTGKYEVLLDNKCTLFLHGEVLNPLTSEDECGTSVSDTLRAASTCQEEWNSNSEYEDSFLGSPFMDLEQPLMNDYPQGEPCWQFPLPMEGVQKAHKSKRNDYKSGKANDCGLETSIA